MKQFRHEGIVSYIPEALSIKASSIFFRKTSGCSHLLNFLPTLPLRSCMPSQVRMSPFTAFDDISRIYFDDTMTSRQSNMLLSLLLVMKVCTHGKSHLCKVSSESYISSASASASSRPSSKMNADAKLASDRFRVFKS